MRSNNSHRCDTRCGLKAAFHDTDTDILTEDRREDVGVSGDFLVQLATGITSGDRSRVSDVSARILARMSVGVDVGVVECGLTNIQT